MRIPADETQAEPPEQTITLLDIVAILARRKLFIVVFTGIIAILTLGLVYMSKVLPPSHPLNYFPDVYRPSVDVLIQEGSRSSDTLGTLLNQSGLGSLSGLLGSARGSGTSADLAQWLLRSDLILDAVAGQFDFIGRYQLSENPKTAARRRIDNALAAEYDPAPGVLTVTYSDSDKVFATEVLNWTVNRLSEQFGALTQARAEERRRDLEKRLKESEDELAAAKQALIDYSVQHQIVDMETQAVAAAGRLDEYRNRRIALQLDKNNQISAGRGLEDPLVQRIQADIDELDRLISQAESGWTTYRPSSIPAQQWPRVASEYLDLKDWVIVRKGVYTVLLQSYEKVRLEEQDQTSIFHVLSYAEVPEVRAAPSRAKICMIATAAGLFLAILIAFVAEYVDRARRDPDESGKLAAIRESLRLRRRGPPPSPERY